MKIIDQNVVIDGIDKTILNFLMEDAKRPILEIAKNIGITGAAVHQRLRKLEKSGLIEGSRLIIDPRLLGYKTMAFVGVYLDKAVSNPLAVNKLKEIPEVIECHYTTGNWSIFVKVLCKDNEHLMKVLNKNIQGIEGVSRTETFISLNQQINRQIKI
ncbi:MULTISPECIES: Lrp/AsnC ligand binding domain-containing protein [Zunongwangia]|jgi:Lrp/AsnC family transcriptional regulator for asnA, asnC and gidA|uniref:Transcription regulator AsnC n=2 Tax=Zunongwangia profunda TaxID=398743 RepID=D5BEW3_ZUNPS|nr:Lrp/AsnC ligand binding domain-containing protein [Zunongwangia profunda]ADF50842.1 transcription regulator AsnC [Zunongwangia profunda SM-A87]MAC64838.1 transcriptional regulator [Flavobacteriaceae bacterium]MAS72409.1 transcriptional regulator [Zunongwangia sp.]HCV82933.1 transcriptional regulator [Zunongwangia profunda]|tara:strand:- start:7551 stop:8021 length:471 start_codon:yes stop_codon:yes gene_type:complete